MYLIILFDSLLYLILIHFKDNIWQHIIELFYCTFLIPHSSIYVILLYIELYFISCYSVVHYILQYYILLFLLVSVFVYTFHCSTILFYVILCYVVFMSTLSKRNPSCQHAMKLSALEHVSFSIFIVSEVVWQIQLSAPWRWSLASLSRSYGWLIAQRTSWRIKAFGWMSSSCMRTTLASRSCSMDANGWVHFFETLKGTVDLTEDWPYELLHFSVFDLKVGNWC